MAVPSESDSLKTLELVHAELVRERDRLRDARRAVTAQLGPLPASAAIVIGLFAGLTGKVHHLGLLIAALAAFVVAIFVGIFFSLLVPYRRMREDRETDAPSLHDDGLPPDQWLAKSIRAERRTYYGPTLAPQPPPPWRPWKQPESLQKGFDLELLGSRIVKALFAAQVVLLVVMRLL